jgi:hypothetical protein
MKEVVKSLGIILIIIGVGILTYTLIRHLNTNIWLGISGLLVVGGLLAYIIMNKYLA